MPSSRIQWSSVTNCGPRWLVLNCASTAIDSPSVASAPAIVPARAARPGSSAPTKAAAAGSQIRIDRCTSARLDQEVEGQAREAEQDERRIGAQEPGLDRPDRGAAGLDDPGGAVDQRPFDEDALERRLAEAAEGGERAHDDGVDRLVEEPLVLEQPVRGAETLSHARRGARALHP